jgi:integrase
MVDASIITEDEYREALGRLGGEWGRRTQDDREATQVALILGYRCGLRRAETSGLRVCDFDDIDFLHVRATNERQLKTSNARRDLPLAILVPPDELEKVRNRIGRIKECVPASFSNEACIFPDTQDKLKPMKDFDSIVRDIHSAFRGDEEIEWAAIDAGFHYHRLRHSLANLILLKLWPGLDKLNSHFNAWDARKEVDATDHSRMLFRNRLFCSEKISAFDLQAIALLLGHGSAATSLEHYIHVLDWYEKPD